VTVFMPKGIVGLPEQFRSLRDRFRPKPATCDRHRGRTQTGNGQNQMSMGGKEFYSDARRSQ
jgi:hypothetical protein